MFNKNSISYIFICLNEVRIPFLRYKINLDKLMVEKVLGFVIKRLKLSKINN